MCDFTERPFILFWEVTRACALACKHCRAIAQPKAHPEELNHEEALALVDEIAELAPPMLVLTGGDPMMRRDIFDIIERATARGLRVALSPAATNRLIHTDFHKLRAAGVVSMSLSLDGATQATHDAFRGVPHTFERTLQAARMAKEAGIQLQINTTISRSTLPELEGFVDILKEIQPEVWSVFLLVPTGRATLEELPGASELEALWNRLLEIVPTHWGMDGTTTAAPSCRRPAPTAHQPRATWCPHAMARAWPLFPMWARFSPAASCPSPPAMCAPTNWPIFTATTRFLCSCAMMTHWAASAAAANTGACAAVPAPVPTAAAVT